MNKRIRTIPLPYRNVGKCAENGIFQMHFSNEKRVKQNFPTVKKTLILVEKKQ